MAWLTREGPGRVALAGGKAAWLTGGRVVLVGGRVASLTGGRVALAEGGVAWLTREGRWRERKWPG